MSVIEEFPYIDGEGKEHADLVKHYSDEGKDIIQVETGGIYTEAVDKYPCKFNYEEVTEEDAVSIADDANDSVSEAEDEQAEETDTSEQSESSLAKNTLKALFDN